MDIRAEWLADCQAAFDSQILVDRQSFHSSDRQNKIHYASYNINIVQTPMAQVVSVLAVIQVFQVRITNADKKFHTRREGQGRLGSG